MQYLPLPPAQGPAHRHSRCRHYPQTELPAQGPRPRNHGGVPPRRRGLQIQQHFGPRRFCSRCEDGPLVDPVQWHGQPRGVDTGACTQCVTAPHISSPHPTPFEDGGDCTHGRSAPDSARRYRQRWWGTCARAPNQYNQCTRSRSRSRKQCARRSLDSFVVSNLQRVRGAASAGWWQRVGAHQSVTCRISWETVPAILGEMPAPEMNPMPRTPPCDGAGRQAPSRTFDGYTLLVGSEQAVRGCMQDRIQVTHLPRGGLVPSKWVIVAPCFGCVCTGTKTTSSAGGQSRRDGGPTPRLLPGQLWWLLTVIHVAAIIRRQNYLLRISIRNGIAKRR
jgi:hypothetical protein